MNIQTVLIKANKLLDSSSIVSGKLDNEILLSKVLKKSRKYLILNSKEKLTKKIFNHLNLW